MSSRSKLLVSYGEYSDCVLWLVFKAAKRQVFFTVVEVTGIWSRRRRLACTSRSRCATPCDENRRCRRIHRGRRGIPAPPKKVLALPNVLNIRTSCCCCCTWPGFEVSIGKITDQKLNTDPESTRPRFNTFQKFRKNPIENSFSAFQPKHQTSGTRFYNQ